MSSGKWRQFRLDLNVFKEYTEARITQRYGTERIVTFMLIESNPQSINQF